MAFMQHTSNLINDCIKWVVLVDLIHSLLGVIDHLICTQLLHMPSSINNYIYCILLLSYLDVLANNRGPYNTKQALHSCTHGIHIMTIQTYG